jgi:hypothetical protein
MRGRQCLFAFLINRGPRLIDGRYCAFFVPSILMYSHSPERNRVDVVDLDPYGTAAPFIDAAVQCITDGGMVSAPPSIPHFGLTGTK